jgi:hypothetical protein
LKTYFEKIIKKGWDIEKNSENYVGSDKNREESQ